MPINQPRQPDPCMFPPGSFMAAAWHVEHHQPVPTVCLQKPRYKHWCSTNECQFLGHWGVADVWFCHGQGFLMRIRPDNEQPDRQHLSVFLSHALDPERGDIPASLTLAAKVVKARYRQAL